MTRWIQSNPITTAWYAVAATLSLVVHLATTIRGHG